MLPALTVLFLCQLAGETLVRSLAIAFPGPVLGMGLFFAALLLAGRAGEGVGEGIGAVADTLLRNLSLLFVPAAVGLVQQIGLIADYWLAIGLGLVVSTVLTLVVTVLTFRAVVRLQERRAA